MDKVNVGVPMLRYFDKDGEDRVIAQYRAGSSLAALAKQEGCCIPTVRNMMSRRGIEVRRRGATARSLSEEDRARLVADYYSGMSQVPLAKKYNVSQASVSRYMRAAGVKMRLRGAAARGWDRCGGRSDHSTGYVMVRTAPDHPMRAMRNQMGYVLEHRLVMAEHLGRPLTPSETVHHIDGDKKNNDIANLELRQGNHGVHVRFRCADC
jgi:transposase-like protein